MKTLVIALASFGLLTLLSVLSIVAFSYSYLTSPIEVKGSPFKLVLFMEDEDWEELEKISYKGTNTVTVVHRSSQSNYFQKVKYHSTSEPFTELQTVKLKEIIEKYE